MPTALGSAQHCWVPCAAHIWHQGWWLETQQHCVRMSANQSLIGQAKTPGNIPNPTISKLVIMTKLAFLNMPNS